MRIFGYWQGGEGGYYSGRNNTRQDSSLRREEPQARRRDIEWSIAAEKGCGLRVRLQGVEGGSGGIWIWEGVRRPRIGRCCECLGRGRKEITDVGQVGYRRSEGGGSGETGRPGRG